MEYEAIECANIETLNNEVNKMIADGWIPLGGVSASLSENEESQYYVISQAMTRDVIDCSVE